MTAPIQVFRYWTCLLSWAVCQTCGRKAAASWRTPTYHNGTWQLTYPDMSKGITCASHALWQTKCPEQPYEIEATGPEKPLHRFKGSQVYVSPERRHWPVYDPTTAQYVDHAHYNDHASTVEETREYLLDQTREESWALSPIRIFMDLKEEQVCILTRILKMTKIIRKIRVQRPCRIKRPG